MRIKHEIRRLLRSLGYDISEFTPENYPLARRRKLFACYAIDTVLDVGANVGRYAQDLRRDVGYTGRILSFEPLRAAFEALSARAKRDPYWSAFNFALGDANAVLEMNIAGNSESSSLLDMLPSHERLAPESGYVGREAVQVRTLDSLFGSLIKPGSVVYLKIDTQGFESRVLAGAEESLARIASVQVEMSLVPLYSDEMLFEQMCILLSEKGFRLVALENVFSDPVSGELLQVDGIFHRS